MKIPDWVLYSLQNELLAGAKILKLFGFKQLGAKMELQIAEMKAARAKKQISDKPTPSESAIRWGFWALIIGGLVFIALKIKRFIKF
jgi:hypothetical protein